MEQHSDPCFYDRFWEDRFEGRLQFDSTGPATKHNLRMIFKFLDSLSFNSVLDVGCGDGLLLSKLQTRFPHAHLEGIEFSKSAQSILRKRFPDVAIHLLDLEKNHIPYTSDIVTCIDVLEHIQDDLRALDNLRTMTAGHLILAVPLGPLSPEERDNLGHVHGYSSKEVDEKVRQSHFTILKSIQWGAPFYNMVQRLGMSLGPKARSSSRSHKRRLFNCLLYLAYFLNIPGAGSRYYLLLKPETGH